jgi:hypothetical protein
MVKVGIREMPEERFNSTKMQSNGDFRAWNFLLFGVVCLDNSEIALSPGVSV